MRRSITDGLVVAIGFAGTGLLLSRGEWTLGLIDLAISTVLFVMVR